MTNIDIDTFKNAIFQTTESYRMLLLRSMSTPQYLISDLASLDLRYVTRCFSKFAFEDNNLSPEKKLQVLQAVKNTLDTTPVMTPTIFPNIISIDQDPLSNETVESLVLDEEKTSLYLTGVLKHCLKQVNNCHKEMDQVIEHMYAVNVNTQDLSLKLEEKRALNHHPTPSNSVPQN